MNQRLVQRVQFTSETALPWKMLLEFAMPYHAQAPFSPKAGCEVFASMPPLLQIFTWSFGCLLLIV